ncbi:transmembrane and immunoglobulin domain-containing protein 2 [Choloepus didactylus]|uniref:transmembrane and immunoglobulin domain-containing protein 2 n=1 Tax=Choloepus didactylus TaxID=27675 RepID=UPI00189C8418|nr:transmembrane and immunoglobulin domain-containing protein 2 [Choloepus didactylus]
MAAAQDAPGPARPAGPRSRFSSPSSLCRGREPMARRALRAAAAAAAAPPVSAPSLAAMRRRAARGSLGNVVPRRGSPRAGNLGAWGSPGTLGVMSDWQGVGLNLSRVLSEWKRVLGASRRRKKGAMSGQGEAGKPRKNRIGETEAQGDRKWIPKKPQPPDVCRLAWVSHLPLQRVGWVEIVAGMSGRREPDGARMGSPGMALVLLVHFWALRGARGATGLSTRQEPASLHALPGSQVTLSCQVTLAHAWERLRVGWTKDCADLCHLLVTNGSLHPELCGPRGRLSWRGPGSLVLHLERLHPNDSGHYVCWAAVEIPELEEARGNGTLLLVQAEEEPEARREHPPEVTQHGRGRDPVVPHGPGLNPTSSFPGLLLPLLAAGAVAVAAVALGAWIWGRRQRRRRDAGNPFYGNVLHRPRGPPKKTDAWPREGRVLDNPQKDKKSQSFYSTSFPQPPSPRPQLPPKTCPGPRLHHPTSTVGVPPRPGPSGQPRPRGTPEVGRGARAPRRPHGDPTGYVEI